MKTKLILSLSLVLAVSNIAFAQLERPAQCTAFLPATIDKNIIKENEAKSVTYGDYGQRTNPSHKNYWHAYSDRANNKTYDKPRGKQYSSLAFNEKVTIAVIKDGYALCIQDDRQDFWPNVSNKATVRGWVPLSNLLLWTTCPTNNFGIYNKAVICANADASNIKTASSSNVMGRLFLNPDEASSGKLKADMKFYFVMKVEGNKALLAHEYTLNGASDKVLYGWVDASSYVHWNQRTCLEPTWDESNAEFFADKKILAKVCQDQKQTLKLVDVQYHRYNAPANGQYDPFMYRMDPYLLRYPILDGGNANMYYCSAFANPSGKAPTGNTGMSEQYEKLNKILENRKKVNIGIVIDGTASMAAYFKAVQNAIKEGMVYFQDKTIKVGVVIFRDKEDGKFVTETYPMTDPANPQLKAFLESGGVYGVKSGAGDKDMQEALYYGIDTALDKFNFKPEESNILLVVGDCGDNGKMGVKAETLVQKMVSRNVSFMGFQVRNDTKEAFQNFNDQLLTLLINETQGRYDSDRASLSAADQKLTSGVRVRAREVRGGYDIISNSNTNIYIGMYRNAETGKEMPVNELVSLMDNSFGEWNKSIQKMTDELVRLVEGDGPEALFETSDGKVNEDIMANKAALMTVLGKETFEALAKSNALLSFKGWTLKKEASSGREYYKPVVFISSDELGFLIEQLAPVYRVARNRSSSRVEYVNAMKALVRSLLPGITQEEINQKGYNEVMRLIAGLNESTQSLKGPSIQDIADPNVVNQGQYLTMVNSMTKKYQRLSEIYSSDYKYARKFAGIKYYWLPMEDLP